MKPTDKPIRRHRFTFTLDLLFEEVTIEAVKRWNENLPQHMQLSPDEQYIALYHEIQTRLLNSPHLHDWIVGWLQADLDSIIYRTFSELWDSDGDPDNVVENDIVREIIAEADDPGNLEQNIVILDDNPRGVHYELDSAIMLNLFQWEAVQLIEQIFDADGKLLSETSSDASNVKTDWL